MEIKATIPEFSKKVGDEFKDAQGRLCKVVGHYTYTMVETEDGVVKTDREVLRKYRVVREDNPDKEIYVFESET